MREEYLSQKFKKILERPIEYRFIFQALSKVFPITVLDVGPGKSCLPQLIRQCGFIVSAIDNVSDYWHFGMYNKYFYVINDDITKTKLKKKFDFITCVSTLEHIKNYEVAAKFMLSLLKKGGYLALTIPYNESTYIENVYLLDGSEIKQNPPFYICQVFSRNEINKIFSPNIVKIIDQEYWQIFSGNYWSFGKRLNPPRQVKKHEKFQLTCILFKKK